MQQCARALQKAPRANLTATTAFKLRDLSWFTLPVCVPPNGATVNTCALLGIIPPGVSLHRMVSLITKADYHTSGDGEDAIVMKNGTKTGVFPSSREALAETRGVSHFVILDGAVSAPFHDQLASTIGCSASEPGFGRLPCQSIEGPLDLGACGLAWCIDKAWGVAWPPAAPRAVVLHASIFPAVDMPLWKFKSFYPSPAGGGGGLSSLPGLPYKPCAALPAALEAHLAPRSFTPTPSWTYAVADDGVPLRDSEHAGQVVRALADALRRGAAMPGLLSPSDAALALFARHHFCVNLEHRDMPLCDEDDVAASDRLARIVDTCLTHAMPPEPYGAHFGYRAALHSLRAQMADAVSMRP